MLGVQLEDAMFRFAVAAVGLQDDVDGRPPDAMLVDHLGADLEEELGG
jgi:hypothetical protein